MQLIEICYVISSIIGISASVPQIVQLVRTKASDEFSLSTWFLWLSTQMVTLTYLIVLGNVLMAIVNVAWVGFYLAMVGLIIHYRHFRKLAPVVVSEEQA